MERRRGGADAAFAAWLQPGSGSSLTVYCGLDLRRILLAGQQFGLAPDELIALTIVASGRCLEITVYAGNERGERFIAELWERGFVTTHSAAWG